MLTTFTARGVRLTPRVDIFVVGTNDAKRVLCAGVNRGQADDLREWFCHIKPIGGDLKIMVQSHNEENAEVSIRTAGSDGGSPGH